VALAGLGGLGWALTEAQWFTLRRFTVPALPAGQPSLRILHLADLHLTPGQRRKIAWVRSLAALDPHLVIDTGDNIAHPDAVPALLEAFTPFLARPGAFVNGSNDYYAPVVKNPARYFFDDAREPHKLKRRLPVEDMTAAFRDAGWRDLTNRRDEAVVDGRRVALVGVDDAHMDRDRFPGSTRAGQAGAASSAFDVRLGVTHAPYRRVLQAMHDDGADLILAGHTHGGQLCVPGWGALVTNCDLDTRRAKGLHGWPGERPGTPGGEDSTWLHVSAGLGASPFTPVRFACRPEASLITLVARD